MRSGFIVAMALTGRSILLSSLEKTGAIGGHDVVAESDKPPEANVQRSGDPASPP